MQYTICFYRCAVEREKNSRFPAHGVYSRIFIANVTYFNMQRNTVNLIGRDDLTRDFYIQRSLYRDEVQNHEYVAGVIVMI